MRSPLVRLLAAAAVAAGLAAAPDPAGAQKRQQPITLRDVDTQLAELATGTPFDYLTVSKVSYGVTGVSSYDDFFRRSAVTYGGFHFGRRLVDAATVQLKKYARSKAAVGALQEEIQELTAGADTSEWTLDQSIAVLAAAKKRDQISQEESIYFLAMSALVAATVPVVRASVETAPALVQTGRSLVRKVPNDFGLFEAPQVALSVNRSAQQLGAVPREGATLAEALVVLSRGLQLLSDGE